MLRVLPLILLIAVTAASFACKKKYRNLVPFDQIESDGSNNYNSIFRKTIEEEKRQEKRHRKNEFRD